MRQQFILTSRADLELIKAHEWYEEQRKGLGNRFRQAIREVFRQIRSRPLIRPCYVRDVRRLNVERFPYCVYYRVAAEKIEILTVFHDRRDPQELERALETEPLPDPEPPA